MTWHALRAFGFIYYNVLDNTHGLPVGWLSRETDRVPYKLFFCDGYRLVEGHVNASAHGIAILEALAK